MIPTKLNSATIGHMRKLNELKFNELDTNDVYTMLKYIILYSLPINEVKTLTIDKLDELANNLSYEVDITQDNINALAKLINDHLGITHENDFEVEPDPKQKKTKTTTN